ncbi:hypothetical protein Pfo_025492 [Paulownia fortunei]|nr:hypothetical protein Pfo_025492 [Paulownia fortunei]
MAFISFLTLICMFCISPWPTFAADIPEKSSLETYIVHVEGPDGQLTTQSEDLESWYHSFLPATTASSNEGEARLIHSYHTVFKGFAARLSPDEVKDMEKKNGFISARPEKKLLLHTTHSPNFLGLNQNMGLWKESNYGKGVIIGVLDTGILPEHPSFSDEGMPPPPAKWKGKCEFNHTTCNNKIIGARYFSDGNDSPLDDDGHGTHTASTAAGNFVKGANLFGNANGTAVGIAPLAHLAIYRVCAPFCSESSILAGMDTAVEDGVDVLSISLGQLTNDFFQDFIALGAFSAMEKGILVSCSAGNYGPLNFSLANEAPWILTVGASTTDRKLRATAVLGNNQQFHGESAYQPKDFPSTLLPLVYAGMLNTSDPDAPFCSSESLNQSDVQGKIVLCELGGGITRIEKGEAVKSAGGAAMILVNNVRYANTTFAEAHVLPATHVSYADGLKIKGYINSTSTPMATILFEGTVIGDDHAPVVAAFSSRGPNFASRGILKPDILGPGVNILAAWPTSVENNTNTKSTFNIISGTSVSCPHLSGVAALLKSTHPDWSPAAIKSAIMTTANVVNLAQNPIEDERFLPASIFATGPGHVNPSRANDPGLVYDIQPKDYIPYLCGLNYTNREVGFFLQRKVNCSVESSIPEAQLNYPSFALTFTTQSTSQMYSRTVTNVGDPNSSYDVEIVPPPGIDVRVKPTTLNFSDLNQKMQYQVTFSRLASAANNTVVQGFLKWTSPKHSVRSPIAVILQALLFVKDMSFIPFLTLICILNFHLLQTFADDTPDGGTLETYIVHVDGADGLFTQLTDLESWYKSFLPTTTAASNDRGRMIYSYRNVFKGFAARLSADEVKTMENKVGFISARPERKLSLHTTHSPNFLGLNQNMGFWQDSNYGKGVIIGVLDTGVFPDHPSFSDEGMPPPPAKWKGQCDFNLTACNNKIIGARYFSSFDDSPLDEDGHGTHTASTAAGNFVKGANVFGNANGTAVGIAPLAHLAIYKVCSFFCFESDIIAAMDTAVDDGVDILSLSLGGFSSNFYNDFIALGAFSAMEKGILVSCSAGNDGPSNFSLSNEAPWILTVGASTIDRKIRATAVLGNNETFDGESTFQPMDFPPTLLPLVYAGMLNTSDPDLPFCTAASLNKTDIRGKIVVCELGGFITRIAKGRAVKNAGGAAMIVVNPAQYGNLTLSESHVLPATHVSYADGLKIKTYINSTSTPVATIQFKGTIIGDDRAPVVAAFSSRGPNWASRGILKPDILGPGVNILAAWPVSVENNTNTNSTFNIISGTSMSCPHLSGVAALLKSVHPDWSPAAIKSAIMTTADVVNLAQNPIEDERFLPANIFATGSGHVNPSKANDPGLVYDIQSDDYIPYLCGLNYTNRQVGSILQRRVNCLEESSIPEAQLNYPSFAITFSRIQSTSQTYTRTVTNVGEPNSSYVVEIVPPPGIDVRVEPSNLDFLEVNQKLQYQVTFSRLNSTTNIGFVQGYLKWNSSKHSVRSPIAVILR